MGLLDVSGVGSVFDFCGKVIDKIFPDKDKANEAKLEMFKLQQASEGQQIQNEFQLSIQQAAINVEEAKNGSVFVSGWRPAVGWVCVIALAYHYVLSPFAYWTAKCFFPAVPALPSLDLGELMTLLIGMLGLGAMRSFDKVRANTDNR